jgi:hypothetical protein
VTEEYQPAELPLTSRNLFSPKGNMMAITEAAISQALDAFQENSRDLEDWKRIIRLSSRIRASYENDLEQAAFDMYELGVLLASVGYPRGQEFQELVRAFIARRKASAHANGSKSQIHEFIRSESIALAQTIFSWDEAQEYRSGEVSRMIHQELSVLYGDAPFAKFIPREEKIKEYIRDVTPDYAKRGGRPRN